MSWYEIVNEQDLRQCDLLPGIEVPLFVAPPPAVREDDELPYDVFTMDAIVLTQSCDLDNAKVTSAVVAQYVEWSKVVRSEGYTNAEKRRKEQARIRKGTVAHYAILCEMPGVLPWSVVDFRQLFTVPVDYLRSRAIELGERVRVNSPYRERISHDFAGYFSRVALIDEPVDFDKWNPPQPTNVSPALGQ